MICLAIESSCDETSLAIIDLKKSSLSQDCQKPKYNSFLKIFEEAEVLSEIISSQIQIHKKYGGVIPEIGAREHAKAIHSLFEIVTQEASQKRKIEKLELLKAIQKIYVTSQPGLKSGLRVGVEFAKSIKFFLEKKFNSEVQIGYQNHLRGHVASCFYDQKNQTKHIRFNNPFPHLHLLVSGGNTQLIYLKSWADWEIIGQTLDDAAGECFDKAGRMIGLPYPAGVWISKIAGMEDKNTLNFPVGMSKKPGLNFSYSGLKTAIRYFVQKQKIDNFKFEKKLTEDELNSLLNINSKNQNFEESKEIEEFSKLKGLNQKLKIIYQICLSSQSVITEQLKIKVKRAIKDYEPKTIGISGGVSANPLLRKKIQGLITNEKILFPPLSLTGDNAVMIGLSGLCDDLEPKQEV